MAVLELNPLLQLSPYIDFPRKPFDLGSSDFQRKTLADVLGNGGQGSCEVSAFHLPDDDDGLLTGMATPVATIAPLSRFNDDDDLFGSESIYVVDTSPWCRSYGGWQVSTCNPYCSHGGLVLLHSLSLHESVHFIVGFELTI
ncbi:hypothetical protein Hanom_Chr04g00368611 [Helianthus anomalus]